MNVLHDMQPSFFAENQTQTKLKDIKGASISIGIPKEVFSCEKRISLTPFSVALLIDNGHHVIMEVGAGLGANFSNHGALIVYCIEVVYKTDIILKVSSPNY